MKEIFEQLIKNGIITANIPLCQDWNIHYCYVPWNMGDPEEDEDYFETEELNENLPAEVEIEIPELKTLNKEEFAPTLNHLFENSKHYESAILESLLKYTFGSIEEGEGYESALELANRIADKKYTKEEFIKRSCSLSSVSIKSVGENELKYISFYFNCGWDEEHGVTVICLDGKEIMTSPSADLASRDGENFISAMKYELEK